MSIQAVAWALDQDLPARPKLVLVSIANHANHTDGCCWLNAETIGAEASCSRRAVFYFVGDLIRNGYIRKAPRRADDGRQRANDYWLMFEREPGPWIKAAGHDNEDREEPDDPQVDGVHGLHPDTDHEHSLEYQGQSAHGAPGPSAPACTHKDSAEPSESNPKKDARAREGGRTLPPSRPRTYKPPPPQPIGAIVADKQAKMIFVFEGTRAWDAWVKFKRWETGVTCWNLTTTKMIDGKQRTGWFFPSLFPPQSTGPPKECSDADLDYFAEHG